MDRENVIKGLAHCTRPLKVGKGGNFCMDCPYTEPIGFNQFKCNSQQMMKDALALIKEQQSIMDDLITLGYPHNFQHEAPWVVDYLYSLTEIIKRVYEVIKDEKS